MTAMNQLIFPDGLRPNQEWSKLQIFDRKRWKRLPFGAFADSINERVEPADAAEEVYVGLDDLDPGSLHIRRWGKGSDVIGTKLRFRKGDIIFGRRRAYQRKLAVAEMDGICSAHAMVVRAKPDMLLPEFVPFLMMSDKFMNRAVEISVGSSSPTINWTTLKKEEFDLPPVEQQRRIVEVLRAVEKVLLLQEAVILSLEENITAQREAIFSSDQESRRLDDLFELQLGKMLSPKSRRGNSPLPYIANRNVQWGRFDLATVEQMDFSPSEIQKFRLEVGDLLVCEGGEVGRSAIWQGQIEDCCFQKAIHRLRPRDGTINTEYMFEFMVWAHSKGIFPALTGHSTIAHLTAVKLKSLQVPLAPAVDREVFLEAIGNLRQCLQRLHEKQDRTVKLRTELLNALL